MVINLKENASEVTEHKSNDLIIEYALISDYRALPIRGFETLQNSGPWITDRSEQS